MKKLILLFTAILLCCCTTIFAQSPYFAPGATWKYLDDGSDQGTAWQALAFDDSGWLEGPAQLGFNEGDEATLLTSGYITYYFRKKVTVDDPNSLSNIVFSIVHDDGMLLHINEVEAARSSLVPAGPVDYLTGMTTFIPNDEENNFFDYNVPNTMFVAGENIIAIEVHQQKVSSSDVSFDCSFNGDYTPTGVLDEAGIPSEFQLSQNYPNPFNPSTTIEFDIAKAGHVTLSVFNTLGQQVATLVDQEMEIGHHTAQWNTDATVTTGIYFYKMNTNGNVQIKKMMYLK